MKVSQKGIIFNGACRIAAALAAFACFASVCAAGTLPEGYTAVDCFYVNNSSLTTTGSGPFSWIDTGVIPKGDWTISIDFAVGSIYKGDTWNLMCSRNGASDDTGRLVFFAAASGVENSEMAGHPRIDLGNVNTTASGINCYEWVGRHSFQYHRGTAYLDGVAVATAATTNFTASGRTVLFASYNASSTAAPNANAFSGAFYGAKFYDGAGALQMHLVPCVRDSDGAVGVYNLGAANPGFMANGGTVPFSIDAPGRELLVNGGFETRTALDTGNYGYLNLAYGNRQARTSAWFGSGAISLANGDYNVPSSFPTGTYCAPVGGNNLSQTFLCDRPVMAQLSFKYMHRQTYNPGVAVDLIVSLDGVQLDSFAVPVNSSTVYNYAKADIFLPYSPEGHTLKFSRSGSGEYYLDNISLVVTDVPGVSGDLELSVPASAELAPGETLQCAVTNATTGAALVEGDDYTITTEEVITPSSSLIAGYWRVVATGINDYDGQAATNYTRIALKESPDDYDYAMAITPNQSYVTSTLVDFPVLVRLSSERQSGFDPADCGTNGENLRFILADGMLLAHEIDYWDVDGESTVWVRVPALAADTILYALWSPKAGTAHHPPRNPKAVWCDYVGVWHMNLDGNKVYDSSGNGYTATNISPDTVTAAADPVVGRAAYSTDVFATDVTDLLSANAAKPISNRSKVTFSGWLSVDSAARSDYASGYIIYRKYVGWGDNTGGATVGYYPDHVNNTGFNSAIVQVFLNSGMGYSDVVNTYPTGSKVASRRQAWIYLTVSIDGTTKAYYFDGAQTGTETAAHGILGPDNTARLSFGTNNKTSGRGDEIRIRNGVASAAWVLADYRNMATQDFVSYAAIGKKAFSVPAIAGVTLPGVGATAVPVVAPVDVLTGDALAEGVDYTLELEDNTFGSVTGKAIVTGIGGYAGCITNTFEILGIVSTNLVGDADWTVYSTLRIASSATVDLKGHTLRLPALYAGGTVTDSVGGGQLIFDVPAGRTVTLNTALTGALKLVKTGAGVLVASKAGQTYTGGTDVLGGVLRTGGGAATDGWLGPNTSTVRCKVYVGPDGVIDPAGSYSWGYHNVTLDGGMVSNTVACAGTSTGGFNPSLSTVGDISLVTTGEYSWTSAGGDLGGATMTIENYNYVTIYPLYWNWSNGTIDFRRGGWFNTSRGAIDIRTCDLRQTGGALNVANALSVRDYYCSFSGDYYAGSAALNVYGTFTPASTYFYGPTMQDGSAIDLSGKSGAWSTTSPNNGNHNGNKTVKFAAGATVRLELGERSFAKGEKVISWTTQPDATFTNKGWKFESRSDGLYVDDRVGTGTVIVIF